jgi:hypothetical protein
MIIYCLDCLLDGSPPADTSAHGTIHEGRAICVRHLKRVVDTACAERIQVPMHEHEPIQRLSMHERLGQPVRA